jgi:phospholipase C
MDPIKHVVLLMLENHSFDQMCGCLKAVYPELEGIDPAKPGINNDSKGTAFPQTETTERQMMLDPHHEVSHVAVQLSEHNGGFVKDFETAFPAATDTDKGYIMGYYPLDFLPALHTLARNFTICDHWYSSLPGPTWPNRFFALSGTSSGRTDMPDDGAHKADLSGYTEQTQQTLFDQLNIANIDWKIYFHDLPQSLVFKRQREPHNAARYFDIGDFYKDAGGDASKFPPFTYIEPHYQGTDQNDDHPPHDIMKAQKLIAEVYNALRGNQPLWESTLLVVFYDEHGGFYDHVVPPPAIPPDDLRQDYTFDQLGLRVPALLISPWVDRAVLSTTFDHTSFLKYLTDKWNLGPLGKRTAAANTFTSVIRTSGTPRTDTPEKIELTADQLKPPDAGKEADANSTANAHQQSLAAFASFLTNRIVVETPEAVSTGARIENDISEGFHKFIAAGEHLFGGHVAVNPQITAAKSNVWDFLNAQKKKAAQ